MTSPRRVVVTGIGIVSAIGNDVAEVTQSLKEGRSGIVTAPEHIEKNFRSQIYAPIKNLNIEEKIDRRVLRFMGPGSAYAHIAMQQAIADAKLTEADIINPRTGIVVGSGGPSTSAQVEAALITMDKGPKRIGPYAVPKAMSSTLSANLATAFQIKGVNYSISSACSTSAHCIGHGAELIQFGKQDIVFAGGGEELDWALSALFDAMGALSSKYNDTPASASRAYDANRDGFVIAGGGGMLVLEEYEHAKARGAHIYAELTGYGANSDGADMVAPSGEGAVRCMKLALDTVKTPVTYINTHGTSTPVGDTKELEALREVFGDKVPAFSSTKSLTGHSLGATGVQEAIYCILMMQNNFIAASAHVETVDPAVGDLPLVLQRQDNVKHQTVLSNSFGFGGTNATLAFSTIEA
jgi:3-oxoacyl-[acyl-carrier-protein] synthase-1